MTQLIQQAICGDAKAIEQLIQLHKSKLTSAAFAYTKNFEEAQDIVQETFLKAFQSLPQLKEPKYFSTWLYKIMIRQCFSVLNQQKRAAQTQLELQQLQTLQQAASAQYDDLYEALHALKPDYQTVLMLHYFYDFKLQEIATMNATPVNTVKTQLHRARLQLKKQLESMQKATIKQQDVNTLLKQQLKEAALQFFTIPASYELCIDDVNEEKTIFLWKASLTEQGYYIEFDSHGKLLSLSQPLTKNDATKPRAELQQIAEQFLTTQYPEALQYLTLTTSNEQLDRICFKFEQLVGGMALNRNYCLIEVAYNGQIIDFNFRGYTKNPPTMPIQLAPKENILANLMEADWTVRLSYLSSETYTVPTSGLYAIYESSVLYHSFDALTGANLSKPNEAELDEPEVYVPLPNAPTALPLETVEAIIGITPSMEIIRQADIDEDEFGMVWREKAYNAQSDKSMNSFIAERFEHTVKATIQGSTGRLKGFIWFKERTGSLDLTFEQCREIAVSFIKTYYPDYLPYVQMQVEEPSFNELHRAFFTFAIFVDGYCLVRETFVFSVNRTTGYIDMLMTPRIEMEAVHAYTPAPLLPFCEAKNTLQQVDVLLQWDTKYGQDSETDQLVYRFAAPTTKQQIKGIDAVTGTLIWMKN